MTETIAYIAQATRDEPPLLCVLHDGEFYRFPISALTASRLVMECSGVVHQAVGGVNPKWAQQEIVEHLSSMWGKVRG